MFYVLDYGREAGIADIGVIVSPETGFNIGEAECDGSRYAHSSRRLVGIHPLGGRITVTGAAVLPSCSALSMLMPVVALNSLADVCLSTLLARLDNISRRCSVTGGQPNSLFVTTSYPS